MSIFDDETILFTGGTGAFGQKFTEIILREHSPKSLRIYSRGELKQFEMQSRFEDDESLRFLIGDVRDKERLHRAMNGVDIVVHTAALKQVPACEYNPIEAVRTNIDWRG